MLWKKALNKKLLSSEQVAEQRDTLNPKLLSEQVHTVDDINPA